MADIKIGVCGAGSMGAGIAQIAATAGHDVFVLDRDEDALSKGQASVKRGMAALQKRGKITADDADAITQRIHWTLGIENLSDCGLVIEAIVENLEIKKSLFEQLERLLSPEAVIATNTSSLPVTALGASLTHRDRFLGLHFFNPAPIMKLVEIVSGLDTDDAHITSMKDLMAGWGKIAVVARDVPGFIVNRLARPFYSEGWIALQEQVTSPATIDALMRDLGGFRMGPLELGDLIGHDINHKAATSMQDAYYGRVRFLPSMAQGQLVAAGRLGRKTGEGIYRYNPTQDISLDYLSLDDRSSDFSAEHAAALHTFLKNPTTDHIDVNGVALAFSDGRTAHDRALELDIPMILLDWMTPEKPADILAFSTSDNKADKTAKQIVKTLTMKAIHLPDRPGLLVLRTWLQLANAAADALVDKVAGIDDINTAMRFGVNYPLGPIEWAEHFGFVRAVTALHHIAQTTSNAMYMPSEGLQQLAAARA